MNIPIMRPQASATRLPDLVCLSHLRWDFVYQRPQHLMSRFAAERRVFYVEEPVIIEGNPRLECTHRDCGVEVVVPHLPYTDGHMAPAALELLLHRFFSEREIMHYALWLYTPMALGWIRDRHAQAIVYDCMDELSGFQNAPAKLKECEAELLKRADLVFTGGHHLYEAKRRLNPNVYPFPSSVDVTHFARARTFSNDPADQAGIPHPRLGFFGVIDERMDLNLLASIADARPEWHIVMVGPVVKISTSSLPKRDNIHYLGQKTYEQLPEYISGWDVALLPFARNAATEYISPTKTPEYLAAGRPVVSTRIRDVVRPYGEMGIVHIADGPEEFIDAIESALAEDSRERLRKVDALLSETSWCRTWGRMRELMEDVFRHRACRAPQARSAAAGSSTALGTAYPAA